MSRLESLAILRTHLIALYRTNQDVRRVAEDAGLNLASINLNESLINIWHNILIQADLHGKVEAVINITSQEYPTWKEKLRNNYEMYVAMKRLEEGELPRKNETKRPEIDFYQFKTNLASILNIPLNEISLLKKMPNSLQIEMPPDAADRLVLLNKENTSQIHSLDIRSIEIINRPTSSSSSIFSGAYVMKDAHTFRIALQGKAIQGITNQMELLINNTSSVDYKQIRIHLQTAQRLITLDPTDFRLTDLKKNTNLSLPIKIHASQAGSYEIQVRANSIPAPEEGFLRTTIQLIIESAPPKCILKIELI